MQQTRRPKWPAQAFEVRSQHTGTNRIMMASEPPTKTFEQLLTADDRAWMREIEKTFSQR